MVGPIPGNRTQDSRFVPSQVPLAYFRLFLSHSKDVPQIECMKVDVEVFVDNQRHGENIDESRSTKIQDTN
jgi:hypothetical protein